MNFLQIKSDKGTWRIRMDYVVGVDIFMRNAAKGKTVAETWQIIVSYMPPGAEDMHESSEHFFKCRAEAETAVSVVTMAPPQFRHPGLQQFGLGQLNQL